MSTTALYRNHLDVLDRVLVDAITRSGRHGVSISGVLFHAGAPLEYHRDDQEIVFRPTPHFARYVPLAGANHCVLARPGRQPLVVRVAPRDFWYETTPPAPSYWQDAVELAEVESLAQVTRVTGPLGAVAYVGNSQEAAATLGMAPSLIEPDVLMAALDWHRAEKTEHEIALMAEACERAARGHRAAREAFYAGQSEREIHWAYLAATAHLERELPYESTVAFDDRCAILHYQNKRGREARARHTFLLDAGAAADGYAADITRTWVHAGAHPVFRALLAGMDAIQRDLVAMVEPARPYLEIHIEAHRRLAGLLADTGIVTAGAEEAFARGVTRTFLPHGVGHHLGLQVHDVGGRLSSPDGGREPPPPEYPFLRNTRTLAPGHVVTIEPGLYFTPMLLASLRASAASGLVDWKLVEQLTPYGGIRIEDDVFCAGPQPRDLTRPHIAGPSDD